MKLRIGVYNDTGVKNNLMISRSVNCDFNSVPIAGYLIFKIYLSELFNGRMAFLLFFFFSLIKIEKAGLLKQTGFNTCLTKLSGLF